MVSKILSVIKIYGPRTGVGRLLAVTSVCEINNYTYLYSYIQLDSDTYYLVTLYIYIYIYN